ncbi:signal peptidase I [Geodermatophilus marinus]|uniref:signal peptidase I n=1 Tax=Geodermatophilus sp. LHW52908 TaxID=2303986 RepID=UPI0013142CAA|nr:signal peptidase I [Geodermatophilus sp. LHW52908]
MTRTPRTAAAVTGDPRTGDRGGAVLGLLRRTAAVTGLLLAVAVAASVAGLLPLQLMRVQSTSMEPTLAAGDLLLVHHGRHPVARGDVVAATDPLGSGLLVKRVVGLGGDRVALEDGVLVVDGEPVCEPAIDPALMDGVWFGPVTVPPGELFLLSDHRDGGIDSRAFGTVPESALLGPVTGRVWPDPGALPSRSAGC